MIACVGVVGKGNDPLFVHSFNSQTDEEKFHFLIHTALDVITERLKQGVHSAYLGMLYPMEEFKVYGYVTITNIKFIVVMDDAEVKDADVSKFFERFHQLFVQVTSNPFYAVGTPIDSARLKVEVARLVTMSA